MDLSPAAQYLYYLMVVVLYTSPLVLIGLVVAWSKGYFLQTLKLIVVSLPLLAGVLQVSFHLNLQLFSFRLQSDRAFYDENFPDDVSVYRGWVIGEEDIRGFTYTRYQFEVDPFLPEVVEILLPPSNVTSVATVELRKSRGDASSGMPAQLVIRNTGSYYTAGNETPKAYFRDHYSYIAGYITDDPLLILTLNPGNNSSVSRFNGLDAKYPWRSQMAKVNF